jgi:hypothetical protein
MSKRRAGEMLGTVVDLALQLTASDGTRDTRALRGRWVRLAQRLYSADDREPATLDEIHRSIEALSLPAEISRRLVDLDYWPHAPLAVAGQLMPERTIERASTAHASLMNFYLAGLDWLRESTRSAFAERFDLTREGLGYIRSELEAIEEPLPEHAPEWVLAIITMLGLLRLLDLP